MSEHIVLTVFLVVLLVGHLVVGGVCIYRMKQDWKRAVQVQQVFTVGDVVTMEQVRRSQAYTKSFAATKTVHVGPKTPPAEPEPA